VIPIKFFSWNPTCGARSGNPLSVLPVPLSRSALFARPTQTLSPGPFDTPLPPFHERLIDLGALSSTPFSRREPCGGPGKVLGKVHLSFPVSFFSFFFPTQRQITKLQRRINARLSSPGPHPQPGFQVFSTFLLRLPQISAIKGIQVLLTFRNLPLLLPMFPPLSPLFQTLTLSDHVPFP